MVGFWCSEIWDPRSWQHLGTLRFSQHMGPAYPGCWAEAACLAQSLERSQAAAPLSCCMVPELRWVQCWLTLVSWVAVLIFVTGVCPWPLLSPPFLPPGSCPSRLFCFQPRYPACVLFHFSAEREQMTADVRYLLKVGPVLFWKILRNWKNDMWVASRQQVDVWVPGALWRLWLG